MLKKFIQEVYQIWITERPTQSAAALAFTSMFSFAPVIFIAISMVGIFADEIQVGAEMYQRLESVLGEEVALMVQNPSLLFRHPHLASRYWSRSSASWRCLWQPQAYSSSSSIH